MDKPLLIILLLLLATLGAFFAGLWPYPFGWIVLALLLVARLLHLKNRHSL